MQSTLDAVRQLFIKGDFDAVLETLEGLGASADALLLRGQALIELGRHAEAVTALERLLAQHPTLNPGLEALARAYRELGRMEEAMAPLRAILARVPGHSVKSVLINLLLDRCHALSSEGREDLALAFAVEAANLNHTAPNVLFNLGSVLNRLNRPAEGEQALRLALTFYPGHTLCQISLLASLTQLGRFEEAETLCQEILAGPACELAESWTNLGVIRYGLHRPAEAEAAFRQALTLNADHMETLVNLANILSVEDRMEEARALYDRARAVRPGHALVDFHAAASLLRAGDWAEGWALYESRFRRDWRVIDPVPPGLPVWREGLVAGRRLLLCCEQGFGDSLQFYRYASLLADQGAVVGVQTPPALVRLFARSDPRLAILTPDQVVPGDWEMGLPLLSAPHRLGTRVDCVPAATPYFTADPAQVAAWGRRLAALPGLKVGLVWAGDARPYNPEATMIDRRRSVSLSMLAGLATITGVSFVSLQKGPPATEIAGTPLPLVDWTDELNDFADTAALIMGLDLVISVDTSVAHLAGGLGKRVFLLSRYDGCWRWLSDRDDTPWYPGMRLFRQVTSGDWSAPLARLGEALAFEAQ